MRELTIDRICRTTGGKLLLGSSQTTVSHVSTDSRTIQPGELFVALRGPNFDGHEFVQPALARGAAGAVVRRDYRGAALEADGPKGAALIAVDDPLLALGDIARYYRSTLAARVIGVTGSNGKTTTKSMIHHILRGHMDCVCSPASFNNAIGVPATLFQVDERHGAAVVEMGTSHPGEIEYLAGIARPHIAVITNISAAHLEGLGSPKGVAEEKAAIIRALPPDGLAVLNHDDYWSRQIEQTWHGARLSFGIDAKAVVRATEVTADETGVSFVCSELRFSVPVLGQHNVYNALAAAAAARALGAEWELIRDRLRTFQLPAMRMERVVAGGVQILNDAYNANPESMDAALATLTSLPTGGRRVFVLGDMKELGEQTEPCHRRLGRKLAAAGVDVLWAVGHDAAKAAAEAGAAGMDPRQLFASRDSREAARQLPEFVQPGDLVLVKGSRANRMEAIVEALREALSVRGARRLEPLLDVPPQPVVPPAVVDDTAPAVRRVTRGPAAP